LAATNAGFALPPLYFEWNYAVRAHQFRSLSPLRTFAGSPVYYSRVEILDDAEGKNGRTITGFGNPQIKTGEYPFTPQIRDPLLGWQILTSYANKNAETVFKKIDRPVAAATDETQHINLSGMVFGKNYEYRYTPALSANLLDETFKNGYILRKYTVEIPVRVVNKETQEWWESSSSFVEKYFSYDKSLRLKSDSLLSADRRMIVSRYYYPETRKEHSTLIKENRIADPFKVVREVNGVLADSIVTKFSGRPELGGRVEGTSKIRFRGKEQIRLEQYFKFHPSGSLPNGNYLTASPGQQIGIPADLTTI